MKTPAELYAHAIEIEREAAARYSEFAERMADLGNEAAAEVFATLARLEAEHLDQLVERSAGLSLPELEAHEYRWLDAGTPETAARELVFRLLTPRCALACEMAADEADHIVMLERLLEKTPCSIVDWASIYEREPS